MRPLPTGTVTFLFTDIEGSTRLLHEVGDAYAEALAEHRRVLREAFTRHGGVEVDSQGDAFFVAFASAKDAVAAAAETQRAMAAGPIRVRMGIHTGEPIVSEEGYIGVDVHRGARIANAGHGGQVLISQTTGDLLDSAVELHDLGEHRLKDLTEAQRLYQLGNGEFPPLRTLHQTNLPVQPTPLIGREQELGEVLELLSRTRLLTLTGAGGSGKTRLALQAAAERVEDYPQGVWWVALAALRDPELVEPTIAQVVAAKDGLVEHLRSQRTLLLLDNFERVLAAAPRIAAMLAEAPEVRVLATSRERLGVGAEQEYPVPTMTPADSLALFSARARQLRPRFEPDATVAEICRRLDGLPLALELAAARVKVLRPEQILARLEHRLELLTTGARDAPERQRTLRAAIEWSYELLDGGERKLFASLAVFAGGFDLEAAEEVAEADVDTLASLVDKSLLRQTPEGRFFMLETIREYALERLDQSGETDRLRREHASWFVALAEEAAPGLTGPDQASCLERLTGDHDNMRAALDWAADAGEDELQLRLTGASFRFWYLRGLLGEARARLETALATQVQAPSLRERVLFGATLIAHRQGEVAAARAYATERLEVCRELDDPARTASAFIGLGLAAELDGDYRLANDAFDEARSKAAEAGDVWTGAVATLDLSDVALLEGDLERAATLGADATRSLRGIGDRAMVAKALSNVGIVELERGELDRARSTFEEGLRLAIELDDGESLIWHLEGVAAVAALEGDIERAATMAALSEAVRDETGFAPQPTQQLLVRHVRRLVDEETLRAAQARAGPMTHEEAMACVLASLS